MSIPLFTKDEITHSTINNSTSKYMFSFPRAQRFPPINRSGYCSSFYDIPSMASKRKTSLGIGNKYDFTKKNKGCQAEFYGIKRDFDKGNLIGPKFTFGICRESYAKVYYDTNKMLDKNIPGPGKYKILRDFGSDAKKYTMGQRLNTFAGTGAKYNVTPGPGAYNPVLKIIPGGKCPISSVENIKITDFGSSKSLRFSYKGNF